MVSIESFLSSRIFTTPKLVNGIIYFISNISGRLSLYSMKRTGSIPKPLLPPQIALQNPTLIGGSFYEIFPELGKILFLLDSDGDEQYKPVLIPIDGGFPEPILPELFEGYRIQICWVDQKQNQVYVNAQSNRESKHITYLINLHDHSYTEIGTNTRGTWVEDYSPTLKQALMTQEFQMGDDLLYIWDQTTQERKLIVGVTEELRPSNSEAPTFCIRSAQFVENGILTITSQYEDTYSPALLQLDFQQPHNPKWEPVEIKGIQHSGNGELEKITHLRDYRYLLQYNIDGSSWVYEATYHPSEKRFKLLHTLVGTGSLSNGVLDSIFYDQKTDQFILTFSSAIIPLQIYVIAGEKREKLVQLTDEAVFGLSSDLLSIGEDASFISHDGMRISARLYLPNQKLGYQEPYPLIYYIHGGPQSQERPDFAWFSMPLIQTLTLKGFAVYVPNVRGSTGYGLSYTQQVDNDWGGNDRLDHVHAMSLLAQDSRIDTSRSAVTGRSYGGYMTQILAMRHPELWKAAVNLFGPYNLLTFVKSIPETWKPYMHRVVGHPEKDREFLLERSPLTYVKNTQCPMLVIQGKNDPRVVESESSMLVHELQQRGKEVEYLLFEDEGHDILKYKNKVECYNRMISFFEKHLKA